MGWGIRVSFQKLASDPTEYGEDDFKLYPQVISLVSSRKKNHTYCSLIPRDQSLLTAWAGWGRGRGRGNFWDHMVFIARGTAIS